VETSLHAIQRLTDRLGQVVTSAEVAQALLKCPEPKVGKTWVLVKKLSKSIYIPCNTADGGANGDSVWAVVSRFGPSDPGALVTVLVRRYVQKRKCDFCIE
jgi:hypothetical protein